MQKLCQHRCPLRVLKPAPSVRQTAFNRGFLVAVQMSQRWTWLSIRVLDFRAGRVDRRRRERNDVRLKATSAAMKSPNTDPEEYQLL